MNKSPIDLVIADKSPLVLAGLNQMFGDVDRFNILASAADGERFMEAVDRLSFDVGIIGWVMPYMNGSEVLDLLGQREGAPRIIVYTGEPSPSVPRQVMMKGGAGFCSKRESPDILVAAAEAVAEGRMVFPFIDMSKQVADPFAGLTIREQELLVALTDGRTNAVIASDFEISVNTVKFHLKNLYEKLDVKNRSQAVVLYLKGSF
ncbi:MAG: response regulator transcription factor [Rhodospirillales bacterium]|nr:response regulator transcription factor [Rhodospirillales bacterium]